MFALICHDITWTVHVSIQEKFRSIEYICLGSHPLSPRILLASWMSLGIVFQCAMFYNAFPSVKSPKELAFEVEMESVGHVNIDKLSAAEFVMEYRVRLFRFITLILFLHGTF